MVAEFGSEVVWSGSEHGVFAASSVVSPWIEELADRAQV